eukprot:RCo047125
MQPKQQPVLLEHAAADVVEHQLEHAVPQGRDLVLKVAAQPAVLEQRLLVQPEEHRKAELVHMVHRRKVPNQEEQLGAIRGEGAVAVALLVQALPYGAGVHKALVDLQRTGFDLVQVVDQGLVLQQTALGVGEVPQQGVLELGELHLRGFLLLQQAALLLLQLRPLMLDRQPQELAFQATPGDREVHLVDERLCVRGKHQLRVPCYQEQSKAFLPVHLLLTDLNGVLRPRSHQISPQDGVQHGIHALHFTHHQSLTKSHRELQGVGKPLVRGVDSLHGAMAGLGEVSGEPAHGLRGWVNDQRRLRRLQNQHSVLHAELIRGQALGLIQQ